jgi:ATP-dependent Clp protease ATP-binding subunit ClpX
LDEFDKIASTGSNIRFGGAGSTKDVSGYGVQRELLKMLEGGTHAIFSSGSWGHQQGGSLSTDHISFVACGAFSGIKELAMREQGTTLGFRKSGEERGVGTTGGVAYHLDSREIHSVDVFQQYGFLPELMGRFSAIVALRPLGRNELAEILTKNVIPAYAREFRREELSLTIPEAVLQRIVEQAMSRQIGARGLACELIEYIEDQAFELFGAGRKPATDVQSAFLVEPPF